MSSDVEAAAAVERLTVWVREQQNHLWDDLADAIESAIDRAWSMRAANIARRIVEAARLAAPTPHGEVPYRLVAGGVYEAVLTAGGVTPDLPDEAEWTRLDELMARHRTTRATERPRYAATVAVINTVRETNWINGGDE